MATSTSTFSQALISARQDIADHNEQFQSQSHYNFSSLIQDHLETETEAEAEAEPNVVQLVTKVQSLFQQQLAQKRIEHTINTQQIILNHIFGFNKDGIHYENKAEPYHIEKNHVINDIKARIIKATAIGQSWVNIPINTIYTYDHEITHIINKNINNVYTQISQYLATKLDGLQLQVSFNQRTKTHNTLYTSLKIEWNLNTPSPSP